MRVSEGQILQLIVADAATREGGGGGGRSWRKDAQKQTKSGD